MVFLASINTANLTGTSILIALVVIAVPTIIAVNSFKKQKKKKVLPPLPSPGPPFQEYLDALLGSRVTASQPEWVDKYGRLFLIKSPLPGIIPNMVGVCDPAIAKELCIRQANQYRPPSRFTTRSAKFAAATRDSVGASLAGTVGEEWKWRRAAFLKEMHKSKLFDSDRKLVEQIFLVGENLCEKLEKAAESKKPVKVDILATEAAFDTILFFIFGKVLSGYDADEIRLSAKDILGYMFASLISPVFHLAKYIPGTSANVALKKRNAAWKVFDSLTIDEIELMLKEAKKEVPRASDRLPGSILESWLAKEPKFFERSLGPIVAEVRGMVLAGFEVSF
jgi:cytochrome P450